MTSRSRLATSATSVPSARVSLLFRDLQPYLMRLLACACQNVSFEELHEAIRQDAETNRNQSTSTLDASQLVGRAGTIHKHEVPTLLGDRVAVVHGVPAHPDSVYRSNDGLPLLYLVHRQLAYLGDLPPPRADDEAGAIASGAGRAGHSPEFHEWIAQVIRSPMPAELRHLMIWAVQQARAVEVPAKAFGRFVGKLTQYREPGADGRCRPVYTTADHAAVFHAVAKRCPFTVCCQAA